LVPEETAVTQRLNAAQKRLANLYPITQPGFLMRLASNESNAWPIGQKSAGG
jgi:hypothetical protein